MGLGLAPARRPPALTRPVKDTQPQGAHAQLKTRYEAGFLEGAAVDGGQRRPAGGLRAGMQGGGAPVP